MDPDGEGRAGGGAPLNRLEGVVTEALPSALYRVRLDRGTEVVAHATGAIDRNFVRLLIGDRVDVELSRADTGRGRILRKI